MNWIRRIMGRSVSDLAKEVDDAKALLDRAYMARAELLGKVAMHDENVRLAQEDYEAACAALVKEHPHLISRSAVEAIKEIKRMEYPTHDEAIANPGAWDPEVIEVDDENDPKYASGVPAIPTSDSAPLPPLDFSERDEDPVL